VSFAVTERTSSSPAARPGTAASIVAATNQPSISARRGANMTGFPRMQPTGIIADPRRRGNVERLHEPFADPG
jgi:hypothetical protein